MNNRRRKQRPDPFEGLTQMQIARKFPMKERIIEHLMVDMFKFNKAMEMLRALGLKIKVASNERDFDIVKI